MVYPCGQKMKGALLLDDVRSILSDFYCWVSILRLQVPLDIREVLITTTRQVFRTSGG